MIKYYSCSNCKYKLFSTIQVGEVNSVKSFNGDDYMLKILNNLMSFFSSTEDLSYSASDSEVLNLNLDSIFKTMTQSNTEESNTSFLLDKEIKRKAIIQYNCKNCRKSKILFSVFKINKKVKFYKFVSIWKNNDVVESIKEVSLLKYGIVNLKLLDITNQIKDNTQEMFKLENVNKMLKKVGYDLVKNLNYLENEKK